MKKNNIPLLFIAALLLFVGCCKDVPCPELTKEDKAWIPYKNGDTLTFKNFENDSIIKFIFSNYTEEPILEVNHTMSCPDRCESRIQVNIKVLGGIKSRRFDYSVKKIESTTYILAGGGASGIYVTEEVNDHALFDLRGATLLDTITIANVQRSNVYEFSTTENVKDFKKVFIKPGIGFLKFSYKTGEEFELID